MQVVSGYPQNVKKDMLLKIYVDFPSALNASGTLKCVVGADTVRGRNFGDLFNSLSTTDKKS